jgi:transcriptional regulator with XRE-family HTH domain
MSRKPPEGLSAAEIQRARRWLEHTDGQRALDSVIGKRLRSAREVRQAEGLDSYQSPRRGSGNNWPHSDKNFSQASFAARLGHTQSWLAKIERGQRAITLFDIHLIAHGLEIDPQALLGPLTSEERKEMHHTLSDLTRARSRAHVTPEILAHAKRDSLSSRRLARPRTAREQERINAARKASLPKKGKR